MKDFDQPCGNYPVVKKIGIFGYGSCGQYVVDFLNKAFIKDSYKVIRLEIVVVSRKSPEEVAPRLNTSIVSGMIFNDTITIRYRQCDFSDFDQILEVVEDEKFDVIAYTGRFYSGVKYGSYSFDNEIGYGVWTPLAFPYIYNIVKAVVKSNLTHRTFVINTSYSDAVVPIIYRMIPECSSFLIGAGNINHLIPRFKKVLGEKATDINFIGSHYLDTHISKKGDSCGSPFFISYYEETDYGRELKFYNSLDPFRSTLTTEEVSDLFYKSKIPMESGQTRNLMIAADVTKLSILFLNSGTDRMHIPGLNGEVGGYPAIINTGQLRFADFDLDGLPIVLSDAIKINQQSLTKDGVAEITNHFIEFTGDACDKMKSVFGFDMPKYVNFEDLPQLATKMADEVMERFK